VGQASRSVRVVYEAVTTTATGVPCSFDDWIKGSSGSSRDHLSVGVLPRREDDRRPRYTGGREALDDPR
jgi:hypothetical protein